MCRPDAHTGLSQHLQQLNVLFQRAKGPRPPSEKPVDTHMIASTKVQVGCIRKGARPFKLVNCAKYFVLLVTHVAPSRHSIVAFT
ncbi:hypothetical protein D3C85_1256280 [compost metagenome]